MESNENKNTQNNWRNSINIKWNKVRQDSSKLLVSTGKLLQIKDQPSADKWQLYRKTTEQDPPPTTIPRDKTLKNLIRYVGIPQDMREKMWPLLTRAAQNHRDNKLEYPEILRNQMEKSNESIAQIEKDLHRTMPRNEYFDKDKDIPRLRSVLVAYSWINPYVGYCQAMNFVCGILLIVMKDEMAFWMMRSIVEDILPVDYYASDLLGIKVDTEVIKDLLEQKLPRISEHLIKLDVVLLPIISEWFLTLFVNCLPYENALRFLDCFFSEGSKILFRFALALFKYNEQKILELHSFEEAFSFVKDMPAQIADAQSMKEVLDLSFDGLWLGSMSLVTIAELRKQYEGKLISEKQKSHFKALKRENRKAILLAENAPPPPANKHLHYVSSDHRMTSDLTELGYLLPSKQTRSAFVAKPFRVNLMAEIRLIEDYVTPPVNFVYNNSATSLSPPVSPRALKPSNVNITSDTPPASPKRTTSAHVWQLVKVPSSSKLQRSQDTKSS